jgi:hypothetical protein
MDKMRILINMSLFFRKLHKLLLVLIMAGLPLQGTLAAIMPLCAQAMKAQDIRAELEASVHSPSSTACSQHDADGHRQSVGNDSDTDDAVFALSCDGAVCHISGGGLPPVAASLNLSGAFSYAASFNSRFSSSLLSQPQRPPLA